jgi:hypothetical protein
VSGIAAVFDTSALLAFVTGHVAVGELIAEIADERRQVAIPASCLAAARAAIDDELAAAHLLLLTTTPAVALMPLGSDRAGAAESLSRVGEFARGAGGDVGVGHTVFVALEHGAHVATMRPDLLAPVLPDEWSILDLR